jgi:hypothetical protein
VLKNGIATTGVEYWTAIVYPQSGQSSNGAFGSQFRNISFNGNGGTVFGTNVMSSGVQFAGAQGSGLGILKVVNYGQRGLWLAPNSTTPASGANAPNDIWVTQVTVGPCIQLDASTVYFNTLRAEECNQSAAFLDADGDPNAGILFGSALSNGANNLNVALVAGEFDGLPFKFWNGAAINIFNITAQTLTGGQSTMAIISHGAQSISLGAMFTFGATPNVFTNWVVDRTTTPTTTIPAVGSGCSTPPCSFPSSLGYSNAGSSQLNALQFPEVSSAPLNVQKATFDGCYGDSTAHALKCSYNNGSFGQVPLGGANLLMSPTAPTIAGAGCGGSAASISAPNGTASFNIFTGTAPTSGGCTVTMPAATTDWHCEANHVSAISTTNFIIQQTGALSTTSVTLQLFSDVAAATAPTASDTWRVTCTAN